MNIKVFKVWLYNVFFVIFVLKSVVNFSMGCCKFATINIRYVKKRFCSVSNFDNEKGFIAKFSGMKKYAAPVVLFVLACALIVYLKVDFLDRPLRLTLADTCRREGRLIPWKWRFGMPRAMSMPR